MSQPVAELVVVTGLSGAGRSTAVAALEDVGYFCVDNLPLSVVRTTLEALFGALVHRVALGIDVRVGAFFEQAGEVVERLLSDGRYRVSVLFLDASDEVLYRRFSGTRRPHPLSQGALSSHPVASTVLTGIALERERLAGLRRLATNVLDTSALNVHVLRRQVIELFGQPGANPRARLRFLSFGFKYGAPMDADMVLDVRFFDNPYFVESLREKSGLDPEVKAFVLDTDDGAGFLRHALDLLRFLLPRLEREGRSYFTVAVGCTGGMHRSVAVAEALAEAIRDEHHLALEVAHRDLGREGDVLSARHPPAAAPRATAVPREGEV